MSRSKGMKIAREVRKWLAPVAKLLRAIAELWNAIDSQQHDKRFLR